MLTYEKSLLWFQQLMQDGGVIMWLILGCSFVAVFIILGRIFHYHRAQIDVQEFLHGLFNILKRNNVVEAVAICDETPGPVAHVLRAALIRCEDEEATLRRAVTEAGLAEVPRLERNLKTLATIAHITPLLGLLGTVLGMIGAFQAMQTAGPFVSTIDLADHIKKALLTTAAGLTVAIPTYAFYNFLVSRVENLVLDMEKAASEMIYFISRNDLTLANAASVSQADGEDAGTTTQ